MQRLILAALTAYFDQGTELDLGLFEIPSERDSELLSLWEAYCARMPKSRVDAMAAQIEWEIDVWGKASRRMKKQPE